MKIKKKTPILLSRLLTLQNYLNILLCKSDKEKFFNETSSPQCIVNNLIYYYLLFHYYSKDIDILCINLKFKI